MDDDNDIRGEQDDNDIDNSFNIDNIDQILLHDVEDDDEQILPEAADAWAEYDRANDASALTANDFFVHLQANFNDDDDNDEETLDINVDGAGSSSAMIFSAQNLPDDDEGEEYVPELSAYEKRKQSKTLLAVPRTKYEYITVNHKRLVNKRIATTRNNSKVIRTTTTKGFPALVYDGFMYGRRAVCNRTNQPVTTWVCVKNCNARITEKQQQPFIYEKTSCHTDNGDVDEIRCRIILNEQKRLALESCMICTEIIGKTLESGYPVFSVFNSNRSRFLAICTLFKVMNYTGVSAVVHALLPSELHQRRRINFFPNARDGLPSHPTNPALLVVPDAVRMVGNELFLLHDNKITSEDDPVGRVIILATKNNVYLLVGAKHLFADGTFKICNTRTKLFTQLWTIHGRIGDEVHPLVFAFMQRKTFNAYRHVLATVLQNRVAGADLITMDFEAAQAKAVSEFFPNAIVKGCFFHTVQIVNRKVSNFLAVLV